MNCYCLYVGDLNVSLKDIDLERIFRKDYEISGLRICKDIFSGNSLGYSYVYFNSYSSAKKALNDMNFYSDTELFKTPIRIMWKNNNNSIRKSGYGNLFIKNLPYNFSPKDLHSLFSEYGEILSSKIKYDNEGSSLGYGFVHYKEMKDAISAINNLNGKLISNKMITVKHFLNKSQRERISSCDLFTNIYVKNLPVDKLSEKVIFNLFGVFGKITSIFIPLWYNSIPKGFAYINFENHEDAEEAIITMNNRKIAGKSLIVCKAINKIKIDTINKKSRNYCMNNSLLINKLEYNQKKNIGSDIENSSNSSKADKSILIEIFSSKINYQYMHKIIIINLIYMSLKNNCKLNVEKILNLFIKLKSKDIEKIIFMKKSKKKKILINFKNKYLKI
ncbi:polyadenylate-binding protein (nucleomorph) [Guillardia theta]|uniref:Polyadenylate-binding protein n=2 Tax=Guillardia theta TaxID=55529 RepID=Q98RZ7_GUITH|nr:polyadenylate-binding protein [Guillardia theta]AAK39803.1 polyadenylate-binding protein [Guillardia theta]